MIPILLRTVTEMTTRRRIDNYDDNNQNDMDDEPRRGAVARRERPQAPSFDPFASTSTKSSATLC